MTYLSMIIRIISLMKYVQLGACFGFVHLESSFRFPSWEADNIFVYRVHCPLKKGISEYFLCKIRKWNKQYIYISVTPNNIPDPNQRLATCQVQEVALCKVSQKSSTESCDWVPEGSPYTRRVFRGFIWHTARKLILMVFWIQLLR